MPRARAADAGAELRRGLEGSLKFILHGVRSRDGKRQFGPRGGPRERAVAFLEIIQRHLDNLRIDHSLTRPLLDDLLEALAEADRGISHPLFAPSPLKGRPPPTLKQWDVMTTAARAIDLYMVNGKSRLAEAVHVVAKRLKERGIEIKGGGKSLLQWRHELTKAGRGQGLGRANGEWHRFGSVYLFLRDECLRQVKEGTLNADAEVNRLLSSL